MEREAEVENGLCSHPKIDEVWEEWIEWVGEGFGDTDFDTYFEALSAREKERFLDKFEDILDDLEDTGREVC